MQGRANGRHLNEGRSGSSGISPYGNQKEEFRLAKGDFMVVRTIILTTILSQRSQEVHCSLYLRHRRVGLAPDGVAFDGANIWMALATSDVAKL